ncbi:unnamed protein product [Microthlaspi erraticum]|uniref:Uncharacterized protein n=1 Tax=Microthlaspi erraticum TaxID=1685480 RepID=A0A6D2I6M2_9BRAS|nr:unnamed protein product [Microthlaspi erraticum]
MNHNTNIHFGNRTLIPHDLHGRSYQDPAVSIVPHLFPPNRALMRDQVLPIPIPDSASAQVNWAENSQNCISGLLVRGDRVERGPLLPGSHGLVGRDVMISVDRGPLPPGSDGAVVRRIGPGEGRAKPIPFLSGRVRSAGC